MKEKEEFIETLQSAVGAENTLHFCYSYLITLMRNCGARKNFSLLSDSAVANKEFLSNLLKDLGAEEFLPDHKCQFCNIKAESFSLQGAISLGLEIINQQIKLYKELMLFDSTAENQVIFGRILKEKLNQKEVLKIESKFAAKEEEKLNFIESYCIPGIIAKLWE
ncbi:MAG: hypothetical protein PHY94_02510 [Candidatus Omnitrophica bacterium]|nr:hypothetical protein [Candidatus Omnitrophota bacterium]